ncbi:PEP-CTERM sorting domain-containing protein [Floridanema aerugineum]|uniref:PEP-CTERM sorting domain-containing protein n=1 Tax=Floridaenema aerugineum BLCC-F46 TaxID=3153654 RepID=A0ABV4X2F5_9CYAN
MEQVKSVLEPTSALGLLALGAMGIGSMLNRKQQQKVTVKA